MYFCKQGVPGLEERIALMRKRSKVNQVVDVQERDDQNTEAAALEMEVAEVVAPPVAPLAAQVAAPEKAKEVQKSDTTSWIDTAAAAGVVTFAAYMIFVTNAPTASAYFFQAGVLFSTGNVKGTALSKVYSDNI